MESLWFDNEDESLDTENEDDLQTSTNNYRKAVVFSTDWTTETISQQLTKGRIDLNPSFQRRNAWDDERKSSFIESLIMGLPIPQIILAESHIKKGHYIVIDGKQRLLSIMLFFSENENESFQSLKLKGLKQLVELNNLTLKDLKESPQLEEYVSTLENQPIRTVVIKNWPSEQFLYTVFLRLNTGSLALSPQELRRALHPGSFFDFSDEFSSRSNEILKILNRNSPDPRMIDIELFIRYFSFKYFIGDYKGNLKDFFDKTVYNLNNEWNTKQTQIKQDANELNEAIRFTYEIFKDNAFKKWKEDRYTGRFNRAIYDIMVYYFSNTAHRNILRTKKSEIESAFKDLCVTDPDFLNSFETSTKNMKPTRIRFVQWGQTLSTIAGTEFPIPTLTD